MAACRLKSDPGPDARLGPRPHCTELELPDFLHDKAAVRLTGSDRGRRAGDDSSRRCHVGVTAYGQSVTIQAQCRRMLESEAVATVLI